MKGLKLLLLVGLCFLFGLTVASAGNIDVDETFTDGTPFTDLNNATTSATIAVKGINPYTTPGGWADWGLDPGKLEYNPTSALTQGSLFALGDGPGMCWKLDPGQQLFWGQAGNNCGGEESGLGTVAQYGAAIEVSQVALAVNPSSADKTVGTPLGSIRYYFGSGTIGLFGDPSQPTGTTHTLAYNLVAGGGGVVDIMEIRDGGMGEKVGTFPGDTWTQITTVFGGSEAWDLAPWATQGAGTGFFLTNTPKGWPNNTLLTSSILTITVEPLTTTTLTSVYTFVDANPLGNATTPAWLVDNPWTIATIPATNSKIRTVRYAAGPADELYIDNLYIEDDMRNGALPASVAQKITNMRSHKFAGEYYPVPAGVPVELSVFTVK